jgi:uncharacterized protein
MYHGSGGIDMKHHEAKMGRVFVIRLEDGEDLHHNLERFAREQGIETAAVIALGGADDASRLVVGPENPDASPIVPMELPLQGVHEISGTGTLIRDENGEPVLHMHVAAGRSTQARTGCTRAGVQVWQVLEVIVFELLGSHTVRKIDQDTGFVLLDFDFAEDPGSEFH